ncbi:MAG: TatD family hydrolase, partial [Deltaproteobacteria bacterium]|nr:TatD family hydrolase [Deltaproteobacteria bacterium]
MQLIDSHCHLNLSDFNENVKAVVERAQAAGVKKMVVVGTDLADSIKALELAHQYSSIFAAIGIHPHNTESVTETDYGRL